MKDDFSIMDSLNIDVGIRNLIDILWEHSYDTFESCEGHNTEAYVIVSGGDGWFEENSLKFGLRKIENNSCCLNEFEKDVKKHGLNPKNYVDKRKTCGCGAGVNGYTIYRGNLNLNQEFLED